MKCNNCGSEWKTDVSRSASITVCPFCHESIVNKKDEAEWNFFDNTKDLLAHVATEYGLDALFGRKHFSDHTSPIMPQGQKNLVKQAFDCGAVKILQDNVNADQQHKEIAVKQAVKKLTDLMFSQEAAERVVWEFTNAIGWGIPEPQGQSDQQNVTTPQEKSGGNPPPLPNGLDPLMQLAAISLQNGDWQEAEGYYKDVLKQSPQYAPAWIGRLCVDLKLSKEDKLAAFADPNTLINHKFFKTAMQFADPTIKTRLDGYIQTINARINAEQKTAAAEAERQRKIAEEAARKKRVQNAFDNADRLMRNAHKSDDYRKAITAFGSIDSNYQDINNQIKSKIAECEKKIAAIEARQKVAEQGDASAQYYLGWMYYNGQGVPQDFKQAVEWYRKAAEQGLAGAQNVLGAMYDKGQGVPQDYKQALEWYRKAAEQGDANAQLNLGGMYYKGQGVPQNYKQALEWYRKAAEQGHAGAQCNLGIMYKEGQGVPQDSKQALEWYRKAAEQGHAGAQCNLGVMYYKGQGVPQDYKQALEWYHKAAEQGLAQAQYNLGVMYNKGQGVPQDFKQAVEWFRKAAEQGHANAQKFIMEAGI